MKKLFVFAIVALAFTACNNSAKPAEGAAGDTAKITSEAAAEPPLDSPDTPTTLSAILRSAYV